MHIKLIGYMEINEPYYNFWPKLIKLEDTPWMEWHGDMDNINNYTFSLVGPPRPNERQEGAYRIPPIDMPLINGQVLCIDYDFPYNGDPNNPEAVNWALNHYLEVRTNARLREIRRQQWERPPYNMEFSDDQLQDIRPAWVEGFLPILTAAPRGNAGGTLAVNEHIFLNPEENENIIPEIGLTQWRRRQKGPAFVEDGEVILKDESGYYCVPRPAAAEGGTFTVARPADAPAHQLRPQLRTWTIFEDVPGEDHDYIFPKYVFRSDLEPVDVTAKALADFLCSADGIKKYRPGYSRNDILSIAISLSQNFLTIFSGEPGTGKTSICNIFAQVLGLREAGRYVPVSVERGWTSKRDFIGYHNPLAADKDAVIVTNARLYHALDSAAGEDAPLLVLLDEANLSPMEYYWSDFMDIAGAGEGEVAGAIDLGGTHPLTIDQKCRFVATINNDHTTEPLSPRIIDRAAVVVLPGDLQDDPLNINREACSGQLWDALQAAFGGEGGTVTIPGWKYTPGGRQLSINDHNELISWTTLQAAFGGWEETDSVASLEAYRAVKAKLMWRPAGDGAPSGAEPAVKPLNVSVSHRTERAIQRFWAAARQEGVFEGDTQEARDTAALDYAVAQHLLPKLGGSGKGYAAALGQLRDLCTGYGLERSAGLLDGMLRRGGEDDAALNYYAFF